MSDILPDPLPVRSGAAGASAALSRRTALLLAALTLAVGAAAGDGDPASQAAPGTAAMPGMAEHANSSFPKAMAPPMPDNPQGSAAARNAVRERQVTVRVPPQRLVRDDGRSVTLDHELDDGRPVVVNFIYTTCFGICPISSQTFSQLQGRLGADAPHVHLVSVSIDPEEDTPAVLRKYAQKYHAGTAWNHYTGTIEASIAVQKAFDVYRGDKMNHEPVTLLRVAPGKPWVRVEGFATADDLLKILRRLQSAG